MGPDQYNDLSDDQLADLARLADGTLPPDRRAEVEARVAASPELTRAFEAQGVALAALHEANRDVGAPARLRAELERKPTRSRPRSAHAGWWRGALAAGTAAVLALALVLPGMLSGGLSVADAAAFATKPATQGAPAVAAGTPQLLEAKSGNLPFPNYGQKFGWSATGRRDDHRSGRHATTVFYGKDGKSVGYTIVSGSALDSPAAARASNVDGVYYRVFRHNDRTVVTWERGGQTCILSAKGVSADELVALASWRGKGAIPF